MSFSANLPAMRLLRLISFAILVCSSGQLAGCARQPDQPIKFSQEFLSANNSQQFEEKRERYLSTHRVSPEIANAMRNGSVIRGMSACEVLLSIGQPTEVWPDESTGEIEMLYRKSYPYHFVTITRNGKIISAGELSD